MGIRADAVYLALDSAFRASIRLPPSPVLTFRNGHRPRRLSYSACL